MIVGASTLQLPTKKRWLGTSSFEPAIIISNLLAAKLKTSQLASCTQHAEIKLWFTYQNSWIWWKQRNWFFEKYCYFWDFVPNHFNLFKILLKGLLSYCSCTRSILDQVFWSNQKGITNVIKAFWIASFSIIRSFKLILHFQSCFFNHKLDHFKISLTGA